MNFSIKKRLFEHRKILIRKIINIISSISTIQYSLNSVGPFANHQNECEQKKIEKIEKKKRNDDDAIIIQLCVLRWSIFTELFFLLSVVA